LYHAFLVATAGLVAAVEQSRSHRQRADQQCSMPVPLAAVVVTMIIVIVVAAALAVAAMAMIAVVIAATVSAALAAASPCDRAIIGRTAGRNGAAVASRNAGPSAGRDIDRRTARGGGDADGAFADLDGGAGIRHRRRELRPLYDRDEVRRIHLELR